MKPSDDGLTRRDFAALLGAQGAVATLAVTSSADAATAAGSAAAPGVAPALGSRPLSRAEFVALIANHFGWVHSSEYVDPYKAVQPTFADVTLGITPWARQIETALEEGIIGSDDGAFHPEAPMMREQAAAICVRAFGIPLAPNDALAAFSDTADVDQALRPSLNALVAAGLLRGRGATSLAPRAAIRGREAAALLAAIAGTRASPPQVMCKAGTTAPRRYVAISTPTPGATIRYSVTFDGSEPPDPVSAGQVYDFTADGTLQFVNPLSSTTDSRLYRLKAVAMKPGLASSPVREFAWNIHRPRTGSFQAKLVQLGNAVRPTIWRISNPAEFFQANVYYIEGSERGLVFDAGEYGYQKANLKQFVDTLATRPYDLIVGHSHPDHAEQIYNFTSAGVRLYVSAIEQAVLRASNRADFRSAGEAAVAVADGQMLDLGNVQLTVWHMPGHTNGLVTVIINQTGWVYGSDMWACNRAYTADTTQYQGVKVDLFLSLLLQLIANYQRSSRTGRIEQVTNAHQEASVGMAGVRNFVQCFQQLIDEGNAVARPSIRGGTKGGDRMSMVGDMWRDRNWMAIGPIGKFAAPVDYLSAPTQAWPCNASIDYNVADGYRKYSVLANIEVDGGTLLGVDVHWAAPANGVPNRLQNKFDPWVYEYVVRVPAQTRNLGIKATALSNRARSITINGMRAAQAERVNVAVRPGDRVVIDVVSPDGMSTSSYALLVQPA